MKPSSTAVTFVIPGDLHLTEPNLANHRASLEVVEAVNQLVQPDFVQFIGDNVQDATEEQYRLFDELRGRLQAPHFALVGDHDIQGDAFARQFRDRFGSTFGSMSLRGFRFLRLDTQQSRPLGIGEEQIAWLGRQLEEAVADGERPILFQHNYPFQVWENFDGPGIDAWRSIVQTRRITAILCGHTHYWQVANDGRNVSIAVRSIGDPEGGAPGYLVGHVEGDDLAVCYRTIEDRGPLVLITHPRARTLTTTPAQIVRGPDRVEVRVWSLAELSRVSGRIDNGESFKIDPAGPGSWSSSLDGARLTKGTHRLEVLAVDVEGGEGRDSIEFAVDPTGRYTSVPRVEPLVESTRFC